MNRCGQSGPMSVRSPSVKGLMTSPIDFFPKPRSIHTSSYSACRCRGMVKYLLWKLRMLKKRSEPINMFSRIMVSGLL